MAELLAQGGPGLVPVLPRPPLRHPRRAAEEDEGSRPRLQPAAEGSRRKQSEGAA